MARKNIIDRIKDLPSDQKVIFWGAAAMAVSVILPWYSDIDAFKTGDTYFGITGPLYMIGILFLGLSGVAIATLFNYTVREKIEMIFSKLATYYMIAGGFCAFLLLLANSVYFHPRFGVNIAIKSAGIGMWVALIGVGMMLYGGYTLRKRRERFTDMESRLEPLIKMPERDFTPVTREHQEVRGYQEIRENRQMTDSAEPVDRMRTIEEISAEQIVRRQDTLL
ncbi:MAG: hypothetical protein NTX63_00385 [Candidatus Peregrinibacteria bacterium]|nr:hypothetical protein [Candidatus Peregrinibacteria bacterium]